MVNLGDYWIKNCDAAAKKEGWSLFNHDGTLQIQIIDDPEEGDGSLDNDGTAYTLCVLSALQGSKLHALALYLDGHSSDDDTYVPRSLMES